MPLRHDTQSSVSPSSAAPIIMAGLVLLGLALVGVWNIPQVQMLPSALPPDMAIAAMGSSSGLSKDTHSQLRLSASGPDWKDITPAQSTVLEPLRMQWPTMSALTKRRWLLLADRYPSMDHKEQEKLHSRMNSWASLSAQQRNQARLNFANVKRLSPQELQAKWDEYQALSDAEKQRLAAKAAVPKGAATAIRPTPKRKLAQVPAAAASAPSVPNPPKIPRPSSSGTQPHVQSHPIAPPAVVETVPVFTPQAAPIIHLPPLRTGPDNLPQSPAHAIEPIAASRPVQVPQTVHSTDLPPLVSPSANVPLPEQTAPSVPHTPATMPLPVTAPHTGHNSLISTH